jgi:hypothetical protein
VPAADLSTPLVLAAGEWRERQARHRRRVDGWLGDDLVKRRRHGRHSIEEFLFTYYSYRPAQLARWHPGVGLALADADPTEFGRDHVRGEHDLVHVDAAGVLSRRRDSIEWISTLLRATASRAPHLGCFGMHEWAMVYQQPPAETRHNALPLRLGTRATSALVEELRVKCSHFDAFRFFTAPARPLNLLQPTRETQIEHEQPGCLHANMDVYRWAYKLAPLTPSELIADCFALAREIRTLDMRASPYDVTAIGLDPLPVETAEGRAEYVRHQRDFAARAAVLRARLVDYCDAILS